MVSKQPSPIQAKQPSQGQQVQLTAKVSAKSATSRQLPSFLPSATIFEQRQPNQTSKEKQQYPQQPRYNQMHCLNHNYLLFK